MAKLGIHKRGHGKEKLMGDSVSHHPAKDAFNESAGSLNSPITSPVHPDLTSMAGGPSMPSSTPAADSNMSSIASSPSMASAPEMGAAPSTPAASGMGFKKGGRVKYAEGSKWIQGAIKHPGSLRKALHVKEGQKIPAKKLEAASHKSGKLGQRARLAKTLKSFKS